MGNPLLSIVTVALNDLSGLKKTFASYLNYRRENIELIVIDGGSSDRTKEFLNEMRSSGRIDFFISEPDKGIYDAMNKGVHQAKGQWIVFMNSGDVFYNQESFDLVIKNIKDEQWDAIYGGTEVLYSSFSRIKKAYGLSKWESLPYVHQSFYCKKELLLAHPFDLDYNICADYEQYWWLKLKGVKFLCMDNILSSVTSGGKSDYARTQAALEKLAIYKKYNGFGFRNLYFYYEYLSSAVVLLIRKVLPFPIIESMIKIKNKI